MGWFYSAPLWLTLPAFLLVFVAGSLGLVVVARPIVRSAAATRADWDRIVGYAITTFGVFFGIFLALVAVSVYQNYVDAHAAVLREVSALGTLYRDVGGLPAGSATVLHADIRDYAEAVIHRDWPSQREGIPPLQSTPELLAIQRHLFSIDPVTTGQQSRYTETISAFNNLVDARRVRVDDAELALPGLLWGVIWVGAAVNATFIASIEVKDLPLHLVMAGLLALFIGLILFVTADMDHPYSGSISVGTELFSDLLTQVMRG